MGIKITKELSPTRHRHAQILRILAEPFLAAQAWDQNHESHSRQEKKIWANSNQNKGHQKGSRYAKTAQFLLLAFRMCQNLHIYHCLHAFFHGQSTSTFPPCKVPP